MGEERSNGGRGKKLRFGSQFLLGFFEDYKCEDCEPETRRERNCDGTEGNKYKLGEDVPGIGDLYRCPNKLLSGRTKRVLNLYSACKKFSSSGIQWIAFPHLGGVLDQSATLLDAFQIIDEEFGVWLKEKEQEEKNGR